MQGIDFKWCNECWRITGLFFDQIQKCYEQVKILDLQSREVASDSLQVAYSPKSVCALPSSFGFGYAQNVEA